MYNINYKNIKKGKNIWRIFLIIGIFFISIILTIITSDFIKIKNFDSKIMSSNVKINSYYNEDGTKMYYEVYYFIVNNKTYNYKSNTSTSAYPSTENKIIYYSSKNPNNCIVEYSINDYIYLLLIALISSLFIIISIIKINKVNKRIKQIKKLNKCGTLIKNIPYTLEDSNTSINNKKIKRIVINYTLKNGENITLYSDLRYDKKFEDKDGLVDLLIDENDTNNYFIDYNIDEINNIEQNNLDKDISKDDNINNVKAFNKEQNEELEKIQNYINESINKIKKDI